MELIQSFALTISRVPLTLHEARILVKIVEFGQQRIKGQYISKTMGKLFKDNKDVRVTIPIAHLLSPDSNHYEDAYEAATRLAGRVVEYADPSNHKFMASALISHVKWERRKGMLSFDVYGAFFNCLYDFTAGFSRYDLETAMTFKRASTIRLYMLLNGQRKPQSYTITNLRLWLGCEDKYPRPSDFIKRVLQPACDEFESSGAMKVSLKQNVTGLSITSVTLTPTYIKGNDINVSAMKGTIEELTDKDVLIELVNRGNFTYRELYAHKDLLHRISTRPDAFELVLQICHNAVKRNKGKGWIIQALRAEAR